MARLGGIEPRFGARLAHTPHHISLVPVRAGPGRPAAGLRDRAAAQSCAPQRGHARGNARCGARRNSAPQRTQRNTSGVARRNWTIDIPIESARMPAMHASVAAIIGGPARAPWTQRTTRGRAAWPRVEPAA